jgi:AcrR family transcriptional regulator
MRLASGSIGQVTNKDTALRRPDRERRVGRRSESQSGKTRARILKNAERLFARFGYRGVAMRRLADAAGVRMFTIHHHFGSKLALYREVLQRGDREIETLLMRVLSREPHPLRLVETVVDELFDYFLANRDWVALNARASLGEGLPARALSGRSWVAFMSSTMRARRIGAPGIDVRLLLVTVEGILNHHALAAHHYHRMFDRDVADERLAAATKAHLKRVILAILNWQP